MDSGKYREASTVIPMPPKPTAPPAKSPPKTTPAPLTVVKMKPRRLYYPSELEPFNEIVSNESGRGIPVGAITSVFGPAEAGKSTLCTQLALEYAMAHEGNVAIHDTELNQGVYDDLLIRLSRRFKEPVNTVFVTTEVKKRRSSEEEKREGKEDVTYDVTFILRDEVKGDATNVFVIQCPEIGYITHLYGHGMNVDVSDGGKVTGDLLKGGWVVNPAEMPLGKFFEEHNVKSFVLDSVTNPIDKIPAVQKNFPGRADVTQGWLIQIINLAWHFELPVFMVAHESRNEAASGSGSQMLDIEGGKAIEYNSKYVLYLMDKNSAGLLPGAVDRKKMERAIPDSGRRLFGKRIPGRPKWVGPAFLEITAEGLVALE